MDKLWAMTVFARVADAGSFSRAAEALDMANASVTTCIRGLERELGVTLLHRDTRRLRLTEEGEVFLGHARQILQSVETAEADVQARVGALSGRLSIETPISFGHALLCPELPRFAARYPGIETSVTLTNQPHHLIERAIDVAIRMDQVEDAEFIARPIFETDYIACCSPQIAATLASHPGKLDPRRCLGLLPEERPISTHWRLQREGEPEVEIRPQGSLHFNTSDALVGAAAEGAGVALVLDIFARKALAEGRLVQVYPDWQAGRKTFFAVTTRARLGAAKVRAFTDFLEEIMVNGQQRPSPNRAVAVRGAPRTRKA